MGAELSKPILEVSDLKKTYETSGTKALNGVTLSFFPGELISLLGENAAGKTTLMKAIVGIEKPDSGSMLLKGEPYSPSNPSQALKIGIGMVPQNLRVIDRLTVLENLLIARKANRLKRTAKSYREYIETLIGRYQLQLPLDREVGTLALAERQRVEILRLLQNSPDILIFDEPTALISENEKAELFETFNKLKGEGKSIVFITHKLREAYSVSDRIYLIRSGVIVGSFRKDEISVEGLYDLMAGEESPGSSVRSSLSEEVVLKVEKICVESSVEGSDAVRDVSFEARKGELIAITGVAGNGQEELQEGLFGVRKVISGRILLGGIDVTNLPPHRLRRLGVASLPSDRDKLASCRGSSIRDNLVIQRVLSGGWVVSGREMDNYARELLSKYGVVFGSIGDPVFTLSGGNLQKLLLAREISSEPKLLLLGEPFRGLDVRHLEKLRSTLESIKEKMAIVIFTSDLDEALIVADRVVVMSEGRIVFSGANGPALSKKAIGEHFAGTLREDRR